MTARTELDPAADTPTAQEQVAYRKAVLAAALLVGVVLAALLVALMVGSPWLAIPPGYPNGV